MGADSCQHQTLVVILMPISRSLCVTKVSVKIYDPPFENLGFLVLEK